MSHDPLDPLTPDEDLLAVSALLDGTPTVDEQTRVDADDELSGLLATLRSQRDELAVVEVPAAARDRALEAALLAFDDLHAAPAASSTTPSHAPGHATPSHTPSNVVRFERRQRTYRLLTGVAAAVGVLFVGALVISGVGGGLGGDDEETSAIMPDEAPAMIEPSQAAADDPSTPMTERAEAGTALADTALADAGDAFSTEAPAATDAPDAPDAPEVTEAGSAGGSEAAATEATAAPAATPEDDQLDGIPGAAGVTVTITNPRALLDYANGAQAILPLPGLALPCVAEGLEAVGEVTYRGTQVVVVRDPATGTVTALDLQDECAVVATITP